MGGPHCFKSLVTKVFPTFSKFLFPFVENKYYLHTMKTAIPSIKLERYACPVVVMYDVNDDFVGFIYNEHEFNKVRIQMMEKKATALFYFVWNNNGVDERITVDESGNMSDFPVGLYDQVRQDLLKMYELTHK